jgi:hypothetical protein
VVFIVRVALVVELEKLLSIKQKGASTKDKLIPGW